MELCCVFPNLSVRYSIQPNELKSSPKYHLTIFGEVHKNVFGQTECFWRPTDITAPEHSLRYSINKGRVMSWKGKHACFLYLHCNQLLYSRQSHYYKLQLEAFLPCKGIHKNMSDHVS